MPHLAQWAAKQPDKPACVFPDTGEVQTYGVLHARADAAARWLAGLLPGGAAFAMLMENHPALFELAFAGQRAGLYYVPLNGHLKPPELAYMLRDSGARVMVASPAMMALAGEVAALQPVEIVTLAEYEAGLAGSAGDWTWRTGRSGGTCCIRLARPASRRACTAPCSRRRNGTCRASGAGHAGGGAVRGEHSVYLSPAPLYHAAPHRFTLHAIEHGATVVVTRRFDAAQVLALIGQLPGDARPVRADAFRAAAGVAGSAVRACRGLQQPAPGDPRGRALPRRGEGGDDRMVGPGDLRILLRLRDHRQHHDRERASG